MLKENDSPFTIDLVGDVTGELFKGTFRAKKVLSYQDYIAADRMRRDVLGGQNPDHAAPYAQEMAEMVSQLSVRLTSWPKWWVEMDGGLKMGDRNVMDDIFEKAVAVQQDALKQKAEEAESNKKELEKSADQ